MFKKFKERLAEVGEEVKKDPRIVNSLASVNHLAQQTYSVLNKADHGSRESLSTQLGSGVESGENGSTGHRRTLSDQYLNANFEFGAIDFSKDTDLGKGMDLANHSFFSLTEDDDQIIASPGMSPVKEPELPRGTSPITRSRRLSSGSMSSEVANLCPIYETPQQLYAVPTSDLDSTAGSEWEADDYSSSHLSAVTKEQLFQMLQKNRARYHKYKGRYVDVVKAYTELQNENSKVKTVMQQTQDKALRRISELREQCQLEQSAKRHLEEELRSDIEEKEHIIKTLQTKVGLLKSGRSDVSPGKSDDASDNGTLVDLSDSNNSDNVSYKSDSEKVPALEDKVKRLEALLTKCKESIKANKQKTFALTEVKENLATQLASKEVDCQHLITKLNSTEEELKVLKGREQKEELQMAEMKLAMHQEIITKDEEISSLRSGLKRSAEELVKLRDEMESLKKARESFEGEKATVISDMSKSQAAIIRAAKDDFERKIEDLHTVHNEEIKDMEVKFREEMKKKEEYLEKEKHREIQLNDAELTRRLKEKEDELRLEREELELRVQALTNSEVNKSKLLKELEIRIQSLASDSVKSSKSSDLIRSKDEEICRLKEEKSATELEIVQLRNECEAMKSIVKDLEDNLVCLQSKDAEGKLEIQSLKNDLEKNSTLVENLQESLTVIGNEKEKLLSELLDFQRDNNSSTMELQKNFDAQIEKIKDEQTVIVKRLEEELQETEKKIKNYESSIAVMEKDSQILNKKLQDQAINLTEREVALAKMKEEYNSSLTLVQEQLQTTGSDLTNHLKENFEAQICSLKVDHQEKLKEVSAELEELKSKLSIETNEKESIQLKCLALNQELESAKQSLEQLQKDLDQSQSSAKFLETKLNQLSGELESRVNLTSRLEFDLKSRENECQNLGREIEALRQCLNEEQKDSAALKERERSQKELEHQMIGYQKDLQEQLRESQLKETHLLNSIQNLETELKKSQQDLETQARNKSLEIEHLKNDLEMKIRLEREKETSFKDHQAQSISYQKRLQEQLEDSVHKLDQSKATISSLQKTHEKEVNQLSARIEYLTTEIETLVADKVELQKKNENLMADLESIQASAEDVKNELTKSTNEIEAIKSQRDGYRKSFEEKQVEVENLVQEMECHKENLHNRSVSDQKVLDEESEKIIQMQEKLKTIDLARANAIKEKEDLAVKVSEFEEKIKTLEIKVSELENERSKIEVTSSRLSELEAELSSSLEKIKVLHSAEENHETQISELTSKLSKAQETIRKLKASRENLQSKIEELVLTQSENQAKLSELESSLEQRDNEIETKEKRVSELEDVLADYGNNIESKETLLEEMQQRIVDITEQTEELRNELKSVQKEKDAQLLEFEDSLETLEKKLEIMRKKNEELTEEKERLLRRADEDASLVASHKSMKDEQDSRLKSVLKDCEKRIEKLEQSHESEVELMRQKARDEFDSAIKDFRLQISELKQELYEKTTLYDEMVDRHQRELVAKQEELDQEVEACNRMCQARLAEYEAEQKAKWQEADKADAYQNSWHWERLQDPRLEIIQRTPTRDPLSKSPPATLAVTLADSNHHNTINSCHHSHSIEEANEYEYLKNILYQYMMGKEPTTLSKVLSAVIKFSPEQTREVSIREEHKQSFLATFGFKPL